MRARLRLPVVIGAALAAAEGAALALRPRPGPAPVPVSPAAYFTSEQLERARRYRRGQLWLYGARVTVELGLLAAAARRPPAALTRVRHPLAAGAAAAAGLSVGTTVATLPLAAIGLARSRRVGLVTQGWGGWGVDVVKSTAIGTAITGAGGALLVAGMQRFGRAWWAPGAGGLVAFGVVGTLAAPLLLEPVFNRFAPLPPGPLRDDVLALGEKAGLRIRQVLEIDASRRTTAANAYVSGLGPTKRVVLFDTLLRDFTPAEVRIVVAHELAHQRFRDVLRGVAFLAVVAPFGTLAAARLAEGLAPDGEAGGAAAVPAVALAAALIAPAVTMAGNQLSRAVEARADRYAMDLTGDPRALVDFHRHIAVKNVADPDPPGWVRLLLGTHPSAMERIGQALAVERSGS